MAVATILLATIPSSSANIFYKRIHVHIVNNLIPNNVLYVRCHCSDHDLGDHYVNVGSEFELDFKTHVFRPTEWHCYLALDRDHHLYYVSYADTMSSEFFDANNNLYWIAKYEGVYIRDPWDHIDYPSSTWVTNEKAN
ncbi:hypothetical protein LINPERPRIM_LOCUS10270 [Linum perenne]